MAIVEVVVVVVRHHQSSRFIVLLGGRFVRDHDDMRYAICDMRYAISLVRKLTIATN